MDYPTINLVATGRRIKELREEKGISVRELQAYLGFEEPQAIYKWQRGDSLPKVDNLYALARYLNVRIEEIIVPDDPVRGIDHMSGGDEPAAFPFIIHMAA